MSETDQDKVAAVFAGRLQTRDLTPEEHSVWAERFSDLMGEPGPEEEAFFAERRRRGLGVGLNENGELVYAEPDPSA